MQSYNNIKLKLPRIATKVAEKKNIAEEQRKEDLLKLQLVEHRNNLRKNEKMRKEVRANLRRMHQTLELRTYHTKQFPKHYHVFRNIAKSYMLRQEDNKDKWSRWRVSEDEKSNPYPRYGVNRKEMLEYNSRYLEGTPVDEEFHTSFLSRAFPEVFLLENPADEDSDWLDDMPHSKSLYTSASASHAMTCPSIRTRPIGNYPTRKPMKFKKLDSRSNPLAKERITPTFGGFLKPGEYQSLQKKSERPSELSQDKAGYRVTLSEIAE